MSAKQTYEPSDTGLVVDYTFHKGDAGDRNGRFGNPQPPDPPEIEIHHVWSGACDISEFLSEYKFDWAKLEAEILELHEERD